MFSKTTSGRGGSSRAGAVEGSAVAAGRSLATTSTSSQSRRLLDPPHGGTRCAQDTLAHTPACEAEGVGSSPLRLSVPVWLSPLSLHVRQAPLFFEQPCAHSALCECRRPTGSCCRRKGTSDCSSSKLRGKGKSMKKIRKLITDMFFQFTPRILISLNAVDLLERAAISVLPPGLLHRALQRIEFQQILHSRSPSLQILFGCVALVHEEIVNLRPQSKEVGDRIGVCPSLNLPICFELDSSKNWFAFSKSEKCKWSSSRRAPCRCPPSPPST